MTNLFTPPKPRQLNPWQILKKIFGPEDGDLLSFLPAKAYRMSLGRLGPSRRGIIIANTPELVREVLYDKEGRFPKSDLMVGALEPLVGPSIFIANGADWQRQRRMIEPAFSNMRVNSAFHAMKAAVDDFEVRMLETSGGRQSLDLAMSELTADIICRTVFSRPLASASARSMFSSFRIFQEKVAQVEIRRLIWDKAWNAPPQRQDFLQACGHIRDMIGQMVDAHEGRHGDLARSVIDAVDPEDGSRFSRRDVINQIAVFFLAGHETTASALTWTFSILAQRPDLRDAIRAEISEAAPKGGLGLSQIKHLPLTRNIFRETLRLYPPITFLPRIAARHTRLGGRRLKAGTLVMISPWVVQRHKGLWPDPDAFDETRFAPGREKSIQPGSYMPFGQGPRVCPGAAFATIEATLILARLIRRFDIAIEEPKEVEPVARLTTKPREQVMCRFRAVPVQ